jgi:hypothetical protein
VKQRDLDTLLADLASRGCVVDRRGNGTTLVQAPDGSRKALRAHTGRPDHTAANQPAAVLRWATRHGAQAPSPARRVGSAVGHAVGARLERDPVDATLYRRATTAPKEPAVNELYPDLPAPEALNAARGRARRAAQGMDTATLAAHVDARVSALARQATDTIFTTEAGRALAREVLVDTYVDVTAPAQSALARALETVTAQKETP